MAVTKLIFKKLQLSRKQYVHNSDTGFQEHTTNGLVVVAPWFRGLIMHEDTITFLCILVKVKVAS